MALDVKTGERSLEDCADNDNNRRKSRWFVRTWPSLKKTSPLGQYTPDENRSGSEVV